MSRTRTNFKIKKITLTGYGLYTLLANRKIMDEEIQCNNCGWTGDSTMLVSKTDALDDRDYNYCPDCGSEDIEDIEDE